MTEETINIQIQKNKINVNEQPLIIHASALFIHYSQFVRFGFCIQSSLWVAAP